MCGGAGGLRDDNKLGQLVLVSEAVRDEGASHHYLPPAPRVATEAQALAAAAEFLKSRRVNFDCGPTWTTDALYRETPARIARRKSQGCLTVEMECAALLAVAKFRGVPLVSLLSCGDNLGSESWDFRDWTSAHDIQDRLLWLAIEVALAMGP
jgi:uridine phosphorylase